MSSEKIINQIHKLRALQKGASNEHEAAAAAAAADRLISKYRISEQEIADSDPSKHFLPEEDAFFIYETGRITHWKSRLAVILAKQYDCAIFNHTTSNDKGRKYSRFRLVGAKSDMEIARYMFTWLSLEIEGLASYLARGFGHTYSQSYCEGCVTGIKTQLDIAKKEERKQAETAGHTAALVKLDMRLNAAEQKLKDLYKLKAAKGASKQRINSGAFERGVKDGKNIHLSKGLDTSKISSLK